MNVFNMTVYGWASLLGLIGVAFFELLNFWIAAILFALWVALAVYGVWMNLRFNVVDHDASHVLGLKVTGPYKDLGRAYARLKKMIPNAPMLGFFYDNPCEVEADACRSFVCAVVSKSFVPEGDGVDELVELNVPAFTAFSTSVPYVNDLSFMLLPFKVYPTLTTELGKKNINMKEAGPSVEIYGKHSFSVGMIIKGREPLQWDRF